MSPLYPWLAEQWPRFSAARDSLHHALVLAGPSGIGKREFALHLMQWIVCQEEGTVACGQCNNCHLFLVGSHPDVHLLSTEQERETGRIELFSTYSERYPDRPGREQRSGPAKIISIEKIRLLIDRFHQSSHTASGRVALLLPADRMNANASNALLKLLEEPPRGSHFLLLTDHPGALLPTIRSRCLVEMLTGPTPEEATEWLRDRIDVDPPLVRNNILSGMGPLDVLADQESGALEWQGANLAALRALCAGQGNPVALAESLAKQDAILLLGWLQRFAGQLIHCQMAGTEAPWGTAGSGEERGLGISIKRLFALYDTIGHYRRIARDQLNLRFALEEILISLEAATASSG